MDGKLVVYVKCTVCHHLGEIEKAALDRRFGNVLPADLKPALRCSQCGALGQIELRIGWSSGSEGMRGVRNSRSGVDE